MLYNRWRDNLKLQASREKRIIDNFNNNFTFL